MNFGTGPGTEVDAPVAAVRTDGSEPGDNRAGYRTAQARTSDRGRGGGQDDERSGRE